MIVAISRNSTGLSSNRRRNPPASYRRRSGRIAARRPISRRLAPSRPASAPALRACDESLVDCRRRKRSHSSVRSECRRQPRAESVRLLGRTVVDAGPELRLGVFDHRDEQMFERAGLGLLGRNDHARRLPGLRNAASIQMASSIHAGTRAGSPATHRGEFRQHLARTTIGLARAAARTATSRRWRTIGTKRPTAGQPDRHRPFVLASPRNHRTGVRRRWRPERSGAQKKRPRDASDRARVSVGTGRCRAMPADNRNETLHDRKRVMHCLHRTTGKFRVKP